MSLTGCLRKMKGIYLGRALGRRRIRNRFSNNSLYSNNRFNSLETVNSVFADKFHSPSEFYSQISGPLVTGHKSSSDNFSGPGRTLVRHKIEKSATVNKKIIWGKDATFATVHYFFPRYEIFKIYLIFFCLSQPSPAAIMNGTSFIHSKHCQIETIFDFQQQFKHY